jgi:hypothetical protein
LTVTVLPSEEMVGAADARSGTSFVGSWGRNDIRVRLVAFCHMNEPWK